MGTKGGGPHHDTGDVRGYTEAQNDRKELQKERIRWGARAAAERFAASAFRTRVRLGDGVYMGAQRSASQNFMETVETTEVVRRRWPPLAASKDVVGIEEKCQAA